MGAAAAGCAAFAGEDAARAGCASCFVQAAEAGFDLQPLSDSGSERDERSEAQGARSCNASAIGSKRSLAYGWAMHGPPSDRRIAVAACAGAPRVDRHLDEQRGGADPEERVERSVDAAVEAEEEFEHGDGDCDDALAHARAHRRFGIGDHEEDEELIHGAGDGRDLRLPGIAGDVRAQERERNKADDIGERDVESPRAPHDHRAKNPDDEERSKVVAPLDAERGHGLRGKKQHGADAEVGGVPEVASANAQRVF